MEIISTLKLKKNNKNFLMKQEQIKVALIKLFHGNKIKWNYISNEKNSRVVNIQKIDLSKDYSNAKIYVNLYSYLDESYNIENIVKSLNKEVALIKHYLCKELKLRKIPQLFFKSGKENSKIKDLENLLNNLTYSNNTNDLNE